MLMLVMAKVLNNEFGNPSETNSSKHFVQLLLLCDVREREYL